MSYGSIPGSSGSSLREIEDNVDQIGSNVKRLEHMNQMINTASDSPKHREDIKKLRQDIRNMIQEVVTMLQTPVSLPEQAEHRRISNKFAQNVAQFKEVVQTGIQKENTFPTRDATSQHYGLEASQRMQQYEQQMGQITIEESASFQVENEIIRENNEAMHTVHSKLSDMHEISKDTAMIVDSQQEMFEHAEKASTAAAARSKQAVRHLETGMKYQSKSRRKQCMIVLCILVAIFIVAFIMALFIGITKGFF